MYMRMVLAGYKGRFAFRQRSSHSLRVTQWAQRIWEEDGQEGDLCVLLCAAILHDVGYSVEDGEDHAGASALLAGKYLETEGYSTEFIQKVCRLIRLHSRKEFLKMPDKAGDELTRELRILMEADLMDECGALAVLWDCMAESREEEQSFEKTYQRMVKNSPSFLERNWMITPAARSYWKDRQEILREYLTAYRSELFLDEKLPSEYEEAAQFMQRTMKGHNLTPNRQGVVYPFRQKDAHMLRVFYQARQLFKSEKARQKDLKHEFTPYAKQVLSYAALLHDIGYRKTKDGLLHAQAGAQMAYEFLKNQGLSEELCHDASELIRLHADKSRLTSTDNPLLLQLLMEADHQDESGAVSIAWDAMASAVRPERDEGLAPLDYKTALERIERYTVRMFEQCDYQTASGKDCWRRKGRLAEHFVQMLRFDLKEWSPQELRSMKEREKAGGAESRETVREEV